MIEEEKEIENPFGIEMEDSEDEISEPTQTVQPTQKSTVVEPDPPAKAKTELSVNDLMSQLDSL